MEVRMDWIPIIAVVVIWWFLQGWLLPRMGVPT
jgi:hypothetical protein